MRSSILIRSPSFLASPRMSPTDGVHDSGSGTSYFRRSRSTLLSPRSHCATLLRLETEGERFGRLRRVRSEADLVTSNRSPQAGLRSPFRQKVAEDVENEEVKWCDLGVAVPQRPQQVEVADQVEYSGGGTGKGRKVSGGKGDGDGDDQNNNRRIANYYQRMLQSDPSNPLLLTNYGRFLHEVEGDAKGAEACYGRAILASPSDSQALSLYGKLIWETHRDGERAESYFERAVDASPNDCYVLGSYAHFLWDAEDEEEEEEEEEEKERSAVSSPLVQAF